VRPLIFSAQILIIASRDGGHPVHFSSTQRGYKRRKEKDMENRGREEFETVTLEDHLSLDEIRINMQTRPGFLTMQKWLVIYNFIVHPRPIWQIAMHTGLSEATVYRIVSDYNRLGPEALDINRAIPFHMGS
jgi:hypothetical protein